MAAHAGASAPAAPLPCLKEGNKGNDRTQKLSGNAAKTAAALEENIAAFIKHYGYENCVLVTITNKKPRIGKAECLRAWRSLKRGVIDKRYPNYIRVPERHANKGQHSHILTHLGVDVRCSFAFAAHIEARKAYAKWRKSGTPADLMLARRCTKLYSESAHSVLKTEWSFWRRLAKRDSYGVGRVEVVPIRESGRRLGRYLAKYLTAGFSERDGEDKGSKLVSYGKNSRWWTTRFSWVSPASNLRRAKLARIARLLSFDPKTQVRSFSDFKVVLGSCWARDISEIVRHTLLPLWSYACCGSLDRMLHYWERDRALFAHFEKEHEAVEASAEWTLSRLWALLRESGQCYDRFSSAPSASLALRKGEAHTEKAEQLVWKHLAPRSANYVGATNA